jgi:hypothetical protein
MLGTELGRASGQLLRELPRKVWLDGGVNPALRLRNIVVRNECAPCASGG